MLVASTVTAAFFTIFNVLQLQLRIYTVKTFTGNVTCAVPVAGCEGALI